jgi:hypothetical protein
MKQRGHYLDRRLLVRGHEYAIHRDRSSHVRRRSWWRKRLLIVVRVSDLTLRRCSLRLITQAGFNVSAV